MISCKAGILLFGLNFIGLLIMNGSAEYLSLIVRNWNSYRTQDNDWKDKYNQFWKCMPFKLVMPFETEFLYVQNQKSKVDLQKVLKIINRYLSLIEGSIGFLKQQFEHLSKQYISRARQFLALMVEVMVPILLPIGSFTFVIFLRIGSYGCSVNQARNNHEFMLGDMTVGVFDPKPQNGHIGPKISMLSGIFIRQFKLPADQQEFYCHTSKPTTINFQPATINSNSTLLEDPRNIFEILSILEETEMSLFDEYLNCIGNAFQVSQDRINQIFTTNCITICAILYVNYTQCWYTGKA